VAGGWTPTQTLIRNRTLPDVNPPSFPHRDRPRATLAVIALAALSGPLVAITATPPPILAGIATTTTHAGARLPHTADVPAPGPSVAGLLRCALVALYTGQGCAPTTPPQKGHP
jgi:hypothetical protein